jgi:hypothetical protein
MLRRKLPDAKNASRKIVSGLSRWGFGWRTKREDKILDILCDSVASCHGSARVAGCNHREKTVF